MSNQYITTELTAPRALAASRDGIPSNSELAGVSMGKASRLKKERLGRATREDPREARRQAGKADRRGRRVSPTVEAYERIARIDHSRVAEALISRYTGRMEHISRYSDYVRLYMFSCLAPVTGLDLALVRLGASPSRPPMAYSVDWPNHLMWGVDSAIAATRLMLCGQLVGGAAVARNQLERWLIHRARAAGITQAAGESTVEYIARAWSAPDVLTQSAFSVDPAPAGVLPEDETGTTQDPKMDHQHVRLSDGSEICPAVVYGFLSELMHGREITESLLWEADGMLRDEEFPAELGVAIGSTADAITGSSQMRV